MVSCFLTAGAVDSFFNFMKKFKLKKKKFGLTLRIPRKPPERRSEAGIFTHWLNKSPITNEVIIAVSKLGCGVAKKAQDALAKCILKIPKNKNVQICLYRAHEDTELIGEEFVHPPGTFSPKLLGCTSSDRWRNTTLMKLATKRLKLDSLEGISKALSLGTKTVVKSEIGPKVKIIRA